MAAPLGSFSGLPAAPGMRVQTMRSGAPSLLPPRTAACHVVRGGAGFRRPGGSRPGQLLRLRELATAERASTAELALAQAELESAESSLAASNGKFKEGMYYADGTYSSGVVPDVISGVTLNNNGNGVLYANGNGQATLSNSTLLDSKGVVLSANGRKPVSGSGIGSNGAYINGVGSNGNGVHANGASSNGNGSKMNGAVQVNGTYANGVSNGLPPFANGTSTSSGATYVQGRADLSAAVQAIAAASPPVSSGITIAPPSVPTAPPVSPVVAAAAGLAAGPAGAAVGATMAEQATIAAANAAALSAAGTPYKSPGGRWSQFKTYSTLQRTLEIWSFAFQFAIKYALLSQTWTYKKELGGMTKVAQSLRKAELATWLREGLVKLGPTFIKIGQQFSTRVDVLSPEFVKELEKLQDNVPPFDSDQAIQIVEDSLGLKVNEVFEAFNPTPLAAASLGQVHLATLRGQQVVVKVQRPGLKELFDIDLQNVRQLAVWLQKLDPKTDGAARDWVAIYDECSRILYQEIDYTLEGANADAFRANFAAQDWVKVPKVYWEYTRPRVLVLEYCPGVKINDAAALDRMGLDRRRLARLSVESYLQQILRHGLFHADPHPGNVAVDTQGRLIYYDFGMMGAIAPSVKKGLLELFYGVYNKDSDQCIDALVKMGVYTATGDRTAVRRTADFFLAAFKERLDQQKAEKATLGDSYNKEFKAQRTKDETKARRKQILSTIGEDLLLAAADQPFRFPAAFTFVVRSFTVLDGIGKSLDPRFDITEISAPYARELLLDGSTPLQRLNQEFGKRLGIQNRAVANLFKNPNKIEGVAATIERLERGDIKLRVRALEAERALARVQVWQRVIFAALMASALVNVGTVLSVSALSTAASASFVGAAAFGLMMLKNYFKVAQLEKKELQLAGAA